MSGVSLGGVTKARILRVLHVACIYHEKWLPTRQLLVLRVECKAPQACQNVMVSYSEVG